MSTETSKALSFTSKDLHRDILVVAAIKQDKGFPCKGGGRRCFGHMVDLFPGCEGVVSEAGSLPPAILFSQFSSLSPTEQWQQGCRWLPLPRLHAAALWLSDTTHLFPSTSGTARAALMKPSSSPEP